MKLKSLAMVACVAVGFAGSLSARADLITNGGFETGDFTGWTANAVSFGMYIVTNPVHSGSFAAQIAGYSSPGPDTLSQTVADSSGQAYTLSFWRYQQNVGPTTYLDVLWNGHTVYSETDLGSGYDLPYQQFTATVYGTGSDSLEFVSANDPGYTYLDDVSLTATNPVPEPETYALMLGGLGLLGLAKRRRGRSAR